MAKDRNAAVSGIQALLPKLNDPDPDIRFMQLSDLCGILSSPSSEYIRMDSHTAARIIEGVLKALADTHGEVQQQALRCIGPLATRTPGDIVAPLIDKITNLAETGDLDTSVPSSALRVLIGSLPQPQSSGASAKDVHTAYTAISKVLIPRLVGRVVVPTAKPPPTLPIGLLEMQEERGYNSDAVDVLIEIVKCFGQLLQDEELVALCQSVMAIIESPQAGGVVKKRALAGVGAILVHFNDAQINGFVSSLVESFRSHQSTPSHRRFLIATIGTLAKSTPSKFCPYLRTLAPFVLHAVGQEELDEQIEASGNDIEVDPETEELRENALIALEALLGACPKEMHIFMPEAIEAALRYLKYDPNVADFEDEEMGGTQDVGSDDEATEDADDEDDEYAELDDEDAFSDIDDLSWKVRRCAAKVLLTMISASTVSDNGILLGKLAPALITRLSNEREENVKLEVVSATSALIKKIGSEARVSAAYANGSNQHISVPNSRKRRRQDSGASTDDPEFIGLIPSRASPPFVPSSPPSGAQADLAALVPKIVQAIRKVWKKASVSLKQATTILLRNIALSRNGALSNFLQQIEDPIADALKPSTLGPSSTTIGSATSATTASLQMESLSLIGTIAETHETRVLLPFVIALIPAVTSTARDRNYKVSASALGATEQLVKALTPPRSSNTSQDNAVHLEKLESVVIDRVMDNNTDLEVRHRAIQVLGVLISRTSASKLLAPELRRKGLEILSERLRNETTRLPSARAVGTIAEAVTAKDHIEATWVRIVSLELAAQLRKSDRALRGSCLEALQALALNSVTVSKLDTKTIQELSSMLLPLLNATDLHLLTPALIIYARMIPIVSHTLVNSELVKALCLVAQAPLVGSPLKAFLLLVKIIGEQDMGSALMKGLLSSGTAGEALVVGRAIGTLVVSGGPDIGVTIPDFLKELDSSHDDKPVCLALAVLGEIGYRMGPSSPLDISVFEKSLSSESDKVRLSAAVALGHASASNIAKFMPIILGNISVSKSKDYLYLHTLRAVLEETDRSAADLAPYAATLWNKLFAVSNVMDNRAIGAECIGRLALIDPETYLSELQHSLQDPDVSVRATVIAAFRFTLADTTSAYVAVLSTKMVPFLETMLTDADIGNRRLAVTTLNSAIHNKPTYVVSSLGKLLPIVISDSYIKEELVKMVSFGPFKMPIDDGLDLRKSTYETMYALLDTPSALPHISITTIFDRILDGITDDTDVRTLCILMIGRLTKLDPEETRRRLSPMAEKFRYVLNIKIKENAVKQEIEKVNEANAAVIRTSLDLDKLFPAAATDGSGEMVVWKGYLDHVKKEFANVVRGIQEEGLG